MDKKDLRIIQNQYWEQKAVVRLQNGNSEAFNTERGVRHGCVLSPKLFNLYSEPIFCVLEELPGLSVGGENINNFRYADSEEKLQKIVNKVKEQSEKLGLYMNVSKTKNNDGKQSGGKREI